MCEPLRGKKIETLRTFHTAFYHNEGGVTYGFTEKKLCYFEDVKSAVEFYKKYKGHLIGCAMLLEEQPKHYHVWDTEGRKSKSYNNWLFDYTFGDVIE